MGPALEVLHAIQIVGQGLGIVLCEVRTFAIRPIGGAVIGSLEKKGEDKNTK